MDNKIRHAWLFSDSSLWLDHWSTIIYLIRIISHRSCQVPRPWELRVIFHCIFSSEFMITTPSPKVRDAWDVTFLLAGRYSSIFISVDEMPACDCVILEFICSQVLAALAWAQGTIFPGATPYLEFPCLQTMLLSDLSDDIREFGLSGHYQNSAYVWPLVWASANKSCYLCRAV